jgi:hypothetical protein
MVSVQRGVHSDEDARALSSLPSGWVACCAAGWWFASRPDGRFPATEYKALGPFLSIEEMTTAVDAEDRRTRTEGDPRD